MSMSVPKLVEGTLYIDRDFDVRTETWGEYVKIGIVKDNKTPEQRVKELQTGNPRQVRTIKTYTSPMVESLETRLHHNFAKYWVRGEWFLMDDDFVEKELHDTITKFIEEQENSFDHFNKRQDLSLKLSNGNRRVASKTELELHSKYIDIKKQNDELNARSQIIKQKLMKALGKNGGVQGVLELRKSTTPEKISPAKTMFSAAKFKLNYEDKYLEFVTTSLGNPKGSLLIKKTPSLSSFNASLREEEKKAKEECERLKVELFEGNVIEPNAKIKSLHEEYISLLGDIFNTALKMEEIKSELSSLLGEDEAIEDVIEWKRKENKKEKFDSKAAQEKYPSEFKKCLIEIPEKITPEKSTFSIIIEMNREYPI